MDKDFAEKIRRRRIKKIAGFLVLIAVCVIVAVSVLKPGSPKSGRAAKATIEIRCDQLSEHPEALNDQGLADQIPEDGTILAKTETDIESGVTSVFDILDRVCRENNIQIEYSYAAGYDSHYIEGINYLYEFSAGRYSGWVFTVNGKSANYGADKIILSGGEEVVWNYTVDYREEES